MNLPNRLLSGPAGWVRSHLPTLLTVLFVSQPLLGILSYWLSRMGMGNGLSLFLRLVVFLAVEVIIIGAEVVGLR